MANEVKIVVTGTNKAKPALQSALSDVQKIAVAVDKIPKAKEIKVTVKDDASKTVDQIDKKKIDNKETKVTAKDDASGEIDKISKTKPKTVVVPVKAEFEGSSGWGKFKDAGSQGASAFTGGFTGGLLGGGLMDAASSLIGDVFKRAGEKQHVAADIQNFMGVSPEAAKSYGDRIGHMFWDGIGDSKEQITGAFGSLSSDVLNWGQLTTAQQDNVVKGAVKISSAFKTDIQEPIKAASAMVNSGLAPSFDAAFDVITTGYQTLGSRADDFLDTLGEYSPQFKELGFSAEQSLGLISQGLKAGARDTDFIADVWKEVGIRIITDAKDVKDALKDLGFKNIAKLQDEIAAGGPKAAENIEKVVTALQKIKDPTEKNRLGVALFGTQYEDTFQSVIEKTDLAAAKMTQFKGATEGLSTGAITETEKMGRAWDKLTEDMGEAFAQQVNHRDQFAEAENDATLSALGFTNTLEEEIAAVYGLGVSLDGTNRGFQALADTVGGYASPKFVEMVGRMNDTQLAAYGVTRSVNTVGQTVLTLPNGKTITIDTNSGKVVSDLSGVRSMVNSLPTQKFFTYYMDTVVRGPGPGTANLPMPFRNAAGGAVVGHAAGGGARSGMTMVNEQGAELGRTQRGDLVDLQGGMTVVPAGQSAMIAAAASGGQGGGFGGGGPTTINLVIGQRVFATAVVDSLRDATRTRAGGSIDKLMRDRI